MAAEPFTVAPRHGEPGQRHGPATRQRAVARGPHVRLRGLAAAGAYRSPVTSRRRVLPVSVHVSSVARSRPGRILSASVSDGLVTRMSTIR